MNLNLNSHMELVVTILENTDVHSCKNADIAWRGGPPL
jgi:hypothetical protein